MKKILTLASAVFLAAFCFIFVNPNVADAYTCSGTWSGKTWNYEVFRPAGDEPYSTGTVVFNNWANTGSNITISFTGPSSGYCDTPAEFTERMDWMYNSDAGAFWAENRNSWSRYLSCGNTHTYTKSTPTPVVNGVCSTARNTCSTGASGNSGENSSEFTWECAGSNGGNTAQCSLDKNNGGGGRNRPNGGTTTNIDPNFKLVCVAREDNVAVSNGTDMIVWTAFDPDGSSSNGYDFTWRHPVFPSGTVFNDSNNAAVTMKSTNLIKLLNGEISVTARASGFPDQTVSCPSASFVEGITTRFNKPIVEPDETCRLNWDDIDPVATPVCKIYNEQGEMKVNISGRSEGAEDVEPNNKYKIVCESALDQENPEQQIGTVQSEFLSCIKKGTLNEI